MTNIEAKIDILGNFYINYKNDKDIKEFIEFNDIGLPLAFLASEGLCELTDISIAYIEETFNMLLATLGVEDMGFTGLDHLLSTAEELRGK